MISIFLRRNSFKYTVVILDMNGDQIVNSNVIEDEDEGEFDGEEFHDWGWSNYINRSEITDPSNNILIDGTLVV